MLAEAEGSRYAPRFDFLVTTGIRRDEALQVALQWRDVDQDASIVCVRGTLARVASQLVVQEPKMEKSRRAIPLSALSKRTFDTVRVRQAADRLRAGSVWGQTGYVFTTDFGKPCHPRNAPRALSAACRRAGVEGVGLHTLRRAAAQVMLNNGVPLKVVSDVLGHSSVAITGDVYGHVAPDVSAEAMASLSATLEAARSASWVQIVGANERRKRFEPRMQSCKLTI